MHSVHQVCIGCFRTRDEIAGWSNFTDEKRKNIIKSLRDRGKDTRPKRKGGSSIRSKG